MKFNRKNLPLLVAIVIAVIVTQSCGLFRSGVDASTGQGVSDEKSMEVSAYIYVSLSTSKDAFYAAAAGDLVEITETEYNNIQTNLSPVLAAYTGAVTSTYYATVSASANSTFSYNANPNTNTTATFMPGHYPVALSYVPSVNNTEIANAGGSITIQAQLKYNDNGTITDLSNVFTGVQTSVVRRYFAVKLPSRLPDVTTYVSMYTGGAGIGSLYGANGSSANWSETGDNVTGFQSLMDRTGLYTQVPGLQVFQVPGN